MRIGTLLLLAALVLPGFAAGADEPPAAADPTRAAGEEAPAAGDQSGAEAAPIDLEALRVERLRRAQSHPVRPRISRYLAAAAEEVDKDDPEEATRLLLKLRPSRLNPYERALVYRMLAFVAYGTSDYQAAIGYFEKVLGEEILSIRDEARIRFNIAQLYASLQDWPQVIAWVKNWLRYVSTPDPLGFYLMGIAYFQLEDFNSAIEYTRKAVESTNDPKEAWLRLLAALYAQTEDLKNATPVLEELVLRYPNKSYWVQLSLIYGARENYRRALAVQQVAYVQGLLTEDKELRRLARSYLYHDLPYPAAKVLEKGLEDGTIETDPESLELLANSWIAAREYNQALAPLEKAAELSEDGNLFVRLGQVHMQREEWSQAAELLGRALDKGGLDDPANATLLLGISYYNDASVGRARSFFQKARGHESTRAEADRWITHIERELGSQQG